MRKFYVKQLVLALLLLMGFTAAAQQTWNCGKVNETDLTATLENGTLTISGKGAMKDYDWNSPWGSSLSSITKVVIKEGVTSIGWSAFSSCSSLTEVTIPSSVTSIGGSAFFSTALTQVIIPNGVTSIGVGAFEACEKLAQVTIPSSVVDIEGGAFVGCENLAQVIIEEGVKSIGDLAFAETALKQIAIPSSVTNIEAGAFAWCPELINITVSESNVNYSSENGVMFSKDKTELVCYPGGRQGDYAIPSYVNSIGVAAFAGCELTQVTIPSSVTTIGEAAFAGCELTQVTIPSSVTTIGEDAFEACKNLTAVTIPSSVTSIEYGAFEDCINLTKVTIPNSVTSIQDYAFYNCTGLTEVTIGEGVTSIGDLAFAGCINLDVFIILNPNPQNIEVIGYVDYQYVETPFDGISNCKLIVPSSSIEAYKTAWSKYIGTNKPFTRLKAYGSALYNIELTGTGGTVSGSGSCAEGSNHTVTAVANEGYTFVNWIENGVVVSRNANYTFAVHQNRTLQAVFVENANSTVDVSDIEIPADKGVAVTVEAENAVVAWTAKANAAGYTLVIKDAAGANIICSLEFDGEGRLSALSFGAALRSTGNAFGFKVTNLEQNTTYSYTLQALDADDNVIETRQGEFTTRSGAQTAISSVETAPATVVGYYNLMGQRLNGEPAQGIYIILYSNGTSQKVFSSK